jgi:hypothetical protein
MTEAEWLTCADPKPMKAYLRGEWGEQLWSERKKRLFVCACCRRIWSELTDERSRRAVVIAEQYVEGAVSIERLHRAGRTAWEVSDVYWSGGSFASGIPRPYSVAAYNATVSSDAWGAAVAYDSPDEIILAVTPDRAVEAAAQCDLLREIVGNLFRPVPFSPAWRTTDVLLLARGIYEERAFDRMPILADALQDAGCDSDDNSLPPRGGNLLGHLRDATATHVRGCWALDLVLEKE